MPNVQELDKCLIRSFVIYFLFEANCVSVIVSVSVLSDLLANLSTA